MQFGSLGIQVPGTRLLSSSIAYINDLPIIITFLELTNIVTNITANIQQQLVNACRSKAAIQFCRVLSKMSRRWVLLVHELVSQGDLIGYRVIELSSPRQRTP